MNSSKTLFSLLFLLVCGLGLSASAKSKLSKVYVFGFAASFTDSLVYLTDIQQLDSAYVDAKTGFLQERSLYGTQLQYFVEKTYQQPNTTCVVFYNVSRKKLESEYLDIRKKYGQDPNLILKTLGGDGFRFVCEEHFADEPQASNKPPKR